MAAIAIDALIMRRKRSAADIIEDLRARQKPGDIDPELAPTDHILRRWAVSQGTGLPAEDRETSNKSRLPPLDDETAIKVDQLILRSPQRTATIVWLWYKTPSPREAIAQALGVSYSSVSVHHRAALSYLRGRFHGAGIDC